MVDKFFARRLPILAAFVVVCPAVYYMVQATYGASYAAFGRDQGIFQYYAWALRQGDLLYRDMRDVNAPLTSLVHLVFQLLGGEDEHRFRVLDLLVTGSVFALLGASLPGIGRENAEKPSKLERTVWAVAAWIVGSASYLSHRYWDTTQRESITCWFLLTSVAAQILGASPTYRGTKTRAPYILTMVAAALTITTWFGKPTFVFFLPGQLLALLWDNDASLTRRKRITAFTLGAAIGMLLNWGFVSVYGDVRAFVKMASFDIPYLYRYIWARSIPELFIEDSPRRETALGLSGCCVIVALVLWRKMPRRALATALLPLGALASIIVQRKGLPYHYEPLEITTRFVWLTLLVWLCERFSTGPVWRSTPAVTLALAMGTGATWQGRLSPHTEAAPGIWQYMHTSGDREAEAFFANSTQTYFYPWEMRLAAKYIQQHTQPTERIAVYGLDPYFLFLARRLSSTPYVYAYELNVSSALAGGTGAYPDAAAREKILEMQRMHSKDFEARLKAHPPAAFVFIEHAPMTSYWDDGPRDLAAWCPDVAEWMNERYKETIRFGVVRVFLPYTSDPEDSPPPDASPLPP
jgi:hypothetical protein